MSLYYRFKLWRFTPRHIRTWFSIRVNILLIRVHLRKPRTSPFISTFPAVVLPEAYRSVAMKHEDKHD